MKLVASIILPALIFSMSANASTCNSKGCNTTQIQSCEELCGEHGYKNTTTGALLATGNYCTISYAWDVAAAECKECAQTCVCGNGQTIAAESGAGC